MTESTVFNIRDICRGCLSDKRDNLRSIFDSNILETFILCTNIQVIKFIYKQLSPQIYICYIFPKVTEKDGLPKLICSSCVYKVISWVTFKTQCEQSDEILKTTFQCSENKGTIESSNEQPTLQFPPQDTVLQDTVDCETVDYIFQSSSEPVKEEVETLLQQSSERNCDVTENIDNWNTSETVVEAVIDAVDSVLPQKSNLLELGANVQEFIEDVDETFEDIESDEDHSKNSNNIELCKTIDMEIEKISTSAKPKQVICDDCGKSFRNLDRLKSHQRGEHEGKKLV